MTVFLVILFLSLLILVHELGHFLAAKLFGIKVEEFGIGFPPKIWSKKIGETLYSINLLPFGGFVKILGENGKGPASSKNFTTQSAWKKSSVILAGILMNVILAWAILSVIFLFGIPKHLVITEIAPNSPAAAANLKPGDIMIEVKTEEKSLQDPIAPNEFLSLVKKNITQKTPLSITIKRGQETIERPIIPRENPPPGEGPIGVAIAETGVPKTPFPKNFVKATTVTAVETKLITKNLYHLLSRIFFEPDIAKNVTGPVGIFSIATSAGELGIEYLAELTALISLNLAILNLIPFPALDGGRFLFILLEKILRKPISFRTQTVTNAIGFLILLVLMGLVTLRDISQLLL